MTDPKNAPPNMDLIRMVQQARMLHDADSKPSEVSAVYWIEVKPRDAVAGFVPVRPGQWVIETDSAQVDALWEIIKAATERGDLGYKSKVSTAPGPGQTRTDARMICIRTADADDSADLERIRAALAALGVSTPMRYEAD